MGESLGGQLWKLNYTGAAGVAGRRSTLGVTYKVERCTPSQEAQWGKVKGSILEVGATPGPQWRPGGDQHLEVTSKIDHCTPPQQSQRGKVKGLALQVEDTPVPQG